MVSIRDPHTSLATGNTSPQITLRSLKVPLRPHPANIASPPLLKKMPLGPADGETQTQSVLAQSLSSSPDVVPDFGKKKKKKVLTNRTFNDVYELTDVVLGEGAASIVKECRDRKHGVAFAAKFINKANEDFSRHKVLAEIAILQKCKGQETILQIIEFFEEDEFFVLIFEKIDGGPLMAHIMDCRSFTERTASLVVKDVATALVFLHDNGIAHRDIKPENILCVFRDRITPVKLADFNLGAARGLQSDETHLNAPVGTPEFMPPEVAEAVAGNLRQPYDELGDVWSLGVIMHMMLTGTAPFSGDCGQDCGWKHGQACELCAEELLENISKGRIDFSADAWRKISGGAKDLIARMLVRAPNRLTARQVLAHPWIQQTPPDIPLATPAKLNQARSVSPFDSFASEANEKLRIADTKAAIAERQAILPRAQGIVPAYNTIVGHQLSDIRTPHFVPSPVGRSLPSPMSRSQASPSSMGSFRGRSTERMISPLASSMTSSFEPRLEDFSFAEE
eukprot:m.92745 g.92745  ORF g.92745 m.92745 type:complete len:509 (-) comp8521_c0_seq1:364-1890(-)